MKPAKALTTNLFSQFSRQTGLRQSVDLIESYVFLVQNKEIENEQCRQQFHKDILGLLDDPQEVSTRSKPQVPIT